MKMKMFVIIIALAALFTWPTMADAITDDPGNLSCWTSHFD